MSFELKATYSADYDFWLSEYDAINLPFTKREKKEPFVGVGCFARMSVKTYSFLNTA